MKQATEPQADSETLHRVFWRFLRYGMLAFGGPVAQIGMIRAELVDKEHWVTREEFNRALALYQILPGPEATELCVWFGMRRMGKVGGLIAGLAFVLPGLTLMLLLSWLYVSVGIKSPYFWAAFAGCQPAVAALIVRAVHRIGSHSLLNRWLIGACLGAAVLSLFQVHFLVVLGLCGLVGAAAGSGRRPAIIATVTTCILIAGLYLALVPAKPIQERLEVSRWNAWAESWANAGPADSTGLHAAADRRPHRGDVPPERLFMTGLKAGLLTFGGAYTVIPFVKADAVVAEGPTSDGGSPTSRSWMTDDEFLDGLALGGILPAPLVIFCTFVGFLGGGLLGALLITAGVFIPAFSFTLVAHDALERLMHHRALHGLLDGVTAGVVGLIGITSITIFRDSVTDWKRLLIFACALAALYRFKSKWIVAAVVGGALAAGLFFMRSA